jgi:hypothetical protein
VDYIQEWSMIVSWMLYNHSLDGTVRRYEQ